MTGWLYVVIRVYTNTTADMVIWGVFIVRVEKKESRDMSYEVDFFLMCFGLQCLDSGIHY